MSYRYRCRDRDRYSGSNRYSCLCCKKSLFQ